MRLSVERAARRSSKPRVSTGNPGERSGGTCGFLFSHPPLGRKRVNRLNRTVRIEVELRYLHVAQVVLVGKLRVRIEEPPLPSPFHDGVMRSPALHGKQEMTPVLEGDRKSV